MVNRYVISGNSQLTPPMNISSDKTTEIRFEANGAVLTVGMMPIQGSRLAVWLLISSGKSSMGRIALAAS